MGRSVVKYSRIFTNKRHELFQRSLFKHNLVCHDLWYTLYLQKEKKLKFDKKYRKIRKVLYI